jgi:hypothetical protein
MTEWVLCGLKEVGSVIVCCVLTHGMFRQRTAWVATELLPFGNSLHALYFTEMAEIFHTELIPCHHGTARLRLQMGEKVFRYEGCLRIYWTSNGGQPMRGGPPFWGVGVTTFDRKETSVLQNVTQTLGRELWHLDDHIREDGRGGTCSNAHTEL